MKKLIKLTAILASLQLTIISAESFGPYQAKILDVPEADTLVVEIEIWPNLFHRTLVRLRGIDSAEPLKTRSRAKCEIKAAKMAINFVKSYILNAETVIISDVASIKSTNNHVFAKVLVNGHDLSEVLVENKYAISTTSLKRKRWSCKNIN